MKKIIVMLVGVGMTLNSAIAAPAVSDISARQRYPWNGLVDLKFTITGESGMKYDASFTAKDMEGNTNVAMKTIRKSDGTTAAAKESLLPGTYSWIWDAAADLPKDFVCERVVVTGTAQEVDLHDKVQLWEGGPYWATTNIGAKEPWEAGYYFWWGDTVGYKRENDKWVASNGSSLNYSFSVSETCYESLSSLLSKGWTISIEREWTAPYYVLAPKYDAAHIHWGGDWRMPTEDELEALVTKCTCTWTTTNGVNGYIFRGRGEYSSSSIFMPCAGWGDSKLIKGFGSYGEYWSSEPSDWEPSSSFDYSPLKSWLFSFTSTNYGETKYDTGHRSAGYSIRPVRGTVFKGPSIVW